MGFWDKVKSVASSAKCLTGWHGGEYAPIPGKPECHVEKTCPDCHEHVTSVKHKYGDWEYIKFGECRAFHECVYCGEQETSVRHQYEKKGKDASCREIERCTNCGDEKLGRAKHNWVEILGHEVSIQGKRKCKDCGEVES